eukprot:CAMPEP_0198683734 /NCGR_PEP_ID=MMETSP1468-20131203/11111_1 /TAXON_ID=1461545 /ORGANISM="Mantoniella sp, Strain CCMP1436" /LENGTH=89 /DNA_ID=CAMNT_0044427985 /DNA_START=298 /DNA_END=564 /DNA_ORIENTATION=-
MKHRIKSWAPRRNRRTDRPAGAATIVAAVAADDWLYGVELASNGQWEADVVLTAQWAVGGTAAAAATCKRREVPPHESGQVCYPLARGD